MRIGIAPGRCYWLVSIGSKFVNNAQTGVNVEFLSFVQPVGVVFVGREQIGNIFSAFQSVGGDPRDAGSARQLGGDGVFGPGAGVAGVSACGFDLPEDRAAGGAVSGWRALADAGAGFGGAGGSGWGVAGQDAELAASVWLAGAGCWVAGGWVWFSVAGGFALA